MKTITSIFMICITMVSIRAALPNKQITNQKPTGFWSGTVEGKDDLRGKPEEYGLCGYALQTEDWNVTVPNCGCKESSARGESRWRCQPCLNTETRATGFQATFCNFKNWDDQVSKTVSSNITNGKWMNTSSCTRSIFASGMSPIFNKAFSSTSTITSFNLQCSPGFNIATDETQVNQNRIGRATSDWKIPNNIITGIKVKSDPKGGITGFTSQYQRPDNL